VLSLNLGPSIGLPSSATETRSRVSFGKSCLDTQQPRMFPNGSSIPRGCLRTFGTIRRYSASSCDNGPREKYPGLCGEADTTNRPLGYLCGRKADAKARSIQSPIESAGGWKTSPPAFLSTLGRTGNLPNKQAHFRRNPYKQSLCQAVASPCEAQNLHEIVVSRVWFVKKVVTVTMDRSASNVSR
jgi:hypothetical protein